MLQLLTLLLILNQPNQTPRVTLGPALPATQPITLEYHPPTLIHQGTRQP